MVPQWVKDAATGKYSRTGELESVSNVYGIGVNYDMLWAGQSSDFTSQSYNFNIESELDTKVTRTYIYCNANTEIGK